MNNADKQYKELLNKILTEGREKKSRAGDTVDLFGGQMRFNLSEGFPLSTLRKVPHKAVFKELFWFLSGSTNVSVLTRQGVHIWDADAYRNYSTKCSSNDAKFDKWMHKNEDGYFRMYLFEEFVQKLETDDVFAEKWGDLGPSYAKMWRDFPFHIEHEYEDEQTTVGGVDQIQGIIDKLKNEPDSRRILLSAWHPYWAERVTLAPCHFASQFGTELLTRRERAYMWEEMFWESYDGCPPEPTDEQLENANIPTRRLNCHLICRSQDFMLGTAFNVPMYALLTELLAYCAGMIAGDLVWSASSIHVYSNQKEQAKEVLAREPLNLPRLKIKEGAPKNIFELGVDHVEVVDYAPHPAIKIPLSVG